MGEGEPLCPPSLKSPNEALHTESMGWSNCCTSSGLPYNRVLSRFVSDRCHVSPVLLNTGSKGISQVTLPSLWSSGVDRHRYISDAEDEKMAKFVESCVGWKSVVLKQSIIPIEIRQ